MAFATNVPNAAESPGVFPAQANTNFSRLKTLINAEHVFNNSADADDGVHRQMTMVARSDPSSVPAGTNSMLYTKLVTGTPQLWFYNGTSAAQVTAVSGATVAASICFNSAGVVQGTPNNATVSLVSSGVYDITFTTPLSSINLPYSLVATEPTTNLIVGKVLSFTTSVMRVRFVNQNNTIITNIIRGSLIVFG